MAAEDLTFDDVVRALDDIVASGAHVQVFIAGRGVHSLVLGLGGQLVHADEEWVETQWKPTYVSRGGDSDCHAFHVDGGQHATMGPCFAICRGLFQTAEAVRSDDLERGAHGLYWRALTLGVDGVLINIGVVAPAEA